MKRRDFIVLLGALIGACNRPACFLCQSRQTYFLRK
jgi:hypothetical protein